MSGGCWQGRPDMGGQMLQNFVERLVGLGVAFLRAADVAHAVGGRFADDKLLDSFQKGCLVLGRRGAPRV